MTINGIEVTGSLFAYDGCHKIYIIENEEDLSEAIELGYTLDKDIYSIKDLQDVYRRSSELRFIYNWNTNKRYVAQGEKAIFRY